MTIEARARFLDHLIVEHGDASTSKCLICLKILEPISFRKHYLIVHTYEKSVCPTCKREFANSYKLKSHYYSKICSEGDGGVAVLENSAKAKIELGGEVVNEPGIFELSL